MLARYISPYEGSPRASAAEYVLGGDVNTPPTFLARFLHHILKPNT